MQLSVQPTCCASIRGSCHEETPSSELTKYLSASSMSTSRPAAHHAQHSPGRAPGVIHEGAMPFVQLLLVLMPQNALLLLEVASRVALEVVAASQQNRALPGAELTSTFGPSYLHDPPKIWHQRVLPTADLPQHGITLMRELPACVCQLNCESFHSLPELIKLVCAVCTGSSIRGLLRVLFEDFSHACDSAHVPCELEQHKPVWRSCMKLPITTALSKLRFIRLVIYDGFQRPCPRRDV